MTGRGASGAGPAALDSPITAPSHLHLSGHGTSLILDLPDDGPPRWQYWGPKLRDGTAPRHSAEHSLPTFSLEHPVPCSLMPGFGLGWFGPSGLRAHRQGQHFTQSFATTQVTKDEAGTTATIVLADTVAEIEITIKLCIDPRTDVLTISTALSNLGQAPLDVDWLAAAVIVLPPMAARVRAFGGRHAAEWQVTEDEIGGAQWHRATNEGMTSHTAFPGAIVLTRTADAHQGLAFGAQLAWSGNHQQTINRLDDFRCQWMLGEAFAPGEVRLAPHATLRAPDVLAAVSRDGVNGVATKFHAAIRARGPGLGRSPRPVHLNTWEAMYFGHELSQLISLADAAADLGVERFVLDDGWFNGRDHDRRGLGDWHADKVKYPDGLSPLVRHVTSLGMQFGLWVEPEMVNPDSDLYRAHPDWVLRVAGRPDATARHQLVLDLSRSDVTDHLFTVLSDLLQSESISYLKWDHNRALTAAGNAAGTASYRQQIHCAYALLDRLRAAFPDVEIEACAAGGGRIDAGISLRTHRFWPSDNLDALSRIPIQQGFLHFFPPERMGAHVGAAPAHATGRIQNIDFRAAVALQGHFGLELDPRQLTLSDRAALKRWISFYKAHRDILHADIRTGRADDGLVWHASGTADRWLLIVYRLSPPARAQAPRLPLPFAIRDADYELTLCHPHGGGALQRLGGDALAEIGITLPRMAAQSACIYLGTRA